MEIKMKNKTNKHKKKIKIILLNNHNKKSNQQFLNKSKI